MLYLISYDVQKDRQRNRICKLLKDWGYHLQKSVFLGDCEIQDDARQIYQKVLELTDLQTDRVFMTPICRQCLERSISSGASVGFEESLWVI